MATTPRSTTPDVIHIADEPPNIKRQRREMRREEQNENGALTYRRQVQDLKEQLAEARGVIERAYHVGESFRVRVGKAENMLPEDVVFDAMRDGTVCSICGLVIDRKEGIAMTSCGHFFHEVEIFTQWTKHPHQCRQCEKECVLFCTRPMASFKNVCDDEGREEEVLSRRHCQQAYCRKEEQVEVKDRGGVYMRVEHHTFEYGESDTLSEDGEAVWQYMERWDML